MSPPLDFARFVADAHHVSSWKCAEFGVNGSCLDLNLQCDYLLLQLRDGIRANPEHPVLRDIPYTSAWALHCYMRPHILDMRHHSHLQSPSDAQLNRPCRRLLLVCCRLHHRVVLRVLQSPRDQRDAT